jgi:hypothetical protein
MSTTDNNAASASAYGVKPMTVAAPPLGSNGSLQQNNTAITNQNTQRQMAARFGGSRRKFKGGAVVVPPVKVSYNDTGVGNTNTSANITNSTKVQADLYAAKQYDSQVGPVQNAGRKKSRRLTGGWPEWGCMSGGKSRRNRRLKSRRNQKLKSRRKLRKSSCRRRKSK